MKKTVTKEQSGVGVELAKSQKARMVKMFGHVPTKEEIIAKIMESQRKLMESLQGAYQATDDPEVRKQTLDAIRAASNLKMKTRQVFEETEKS